MNVQNEVRKKKKRKKKRKATVTKGIVSKPLCCLQLDYNYSYVLDLEACTVRRITIIREVSAHGD